MTILANAGGHSGSARFNAATAATLTAFACFFGLGATPAALAQQSPATASEQPSAALEESSDSMRSNRQGQNRMPFFLPGFRGTNRTTNIGSGKDCGGDPIEGRNEAAQCD